MTLALLPHRLGIGFGPTEVWNALVAAAGTRIALGEAGTVLAYAPAEPPGPQAPLLKLRLPPLSGPSFCEILDFPFRERFGVDLGVADLGTLPDGLRAALVEGIVGTVRAMLPPALADGLAVEAQGLAGAFPELASPALQPFEAELRRADGLAVRLRLICDRASLVALAARHLPPPFGAGDGRLEAVGAQIATPVDMTLGSLVLTIDEMKALEPGAVAVLPERPAGLIVLRAEGRLFEFRDAGGGWQCAGPRRIDAPAPRGPIFPSSPIFPSAHGRPMDEAPFPNESETAAEAEGETFSLGDLRVAVDFDIGRSLVPLATVASWRAGALVELGAPPLAGGLPVTIRVNGDAVGTGDLVQIDDRIAVRITRLSLRS